MYDSVLLRKNATRKKYYEYYYYIVPTVFTKQNYKHIFYAFLIEKLSLIPSHLKLYKKDF